MTTANSEIKPLIDALDFIKFTDRSIGNKFTLALKALDIDLQEAEGGPYEPSTEAEQALNELSLEIVDALEKAAEEDEEKEDEDELEVELEEDLDDEDLEDQTDALDDPTLEDDEVPEVIKPE